MKQCLRCGKDFPTKGPKKYCLQCSKIINKEQQEIWRAKHKLDLYGGSGSTLIACEKTGRTCFTMELDPVYIEVIIKRFHKINPDAEIKCLNREININEILSDKK